MYKMRKPFLLLIVATIIFSLNLSSAIDVTAKSNSTTAHSHDEQDIILITGDEAKEFIDTTLYAIKIGNLKNIASTSAFKLKDSSVYYVGGGVTAVTIPIYGKYSLTSNLTIFFDEHKNIIQTNEMIVKENKLGNFQVETYLDGKLYSSEDTGIAYMTDEELLAEDPISSDIKLMGVGAVASCLAAVLGIGGTVALIIAKACAGSCVTPSPITAKICAACIGAYAVLGTGGITGAVACFKYL